MNRVLIVIAITLTLAGCAGAGPAGIVGGRPRCAAGVQDEQRPLFFIFCVESP